MFIKSTDKKEKIVNLANVSNIYIDGKTSGKIIFNMNYSVKIFGDKLTPDYVYWVFKSEDELEALTKSFIDYLPDMGWIIPSEQGQRYVNANCISSIGTDERKNRVIFNLNYNVTHPKDYTKLTSDFVFYNFSTHDKYKEFVDAMMGEEKNENENEGNKS